MVDNVTPRVRMPSEASAGEVIMIRTLISHAMESGQRVDGDGNTIPRSIVNRFTCEFNGELVMDMTLEPAISANPFIEFEALVPESGTFQFRWYDDNGSVYSAERQIAVS